MDELPQLILASGSPRRRELLAGAGLRFTIAAPDIDEAALPGESPEDLVVRLAVEKARAIAARTEGPACVLAADTVVVLGADILGKPRDASEACEMLRRLSGRTHRVLTGYAILCNPDRALERGMTESRVTFRVVEEAEARAYVATGESLDKAGAYAVQGRAGSFVSHIEGLRSNVIGLPLEEVLPLLARFGVRAA